MHKNDIQSKFLFLNGKSLVFASKKIFFSQSIYFMHLINKVDIGLNSEKSKAHIFGQIKSRKNDMKYYFYSFLFLLKKLGAKLRKIF